jgi:hypothetical protein
VVDVQVQLNAAASGPATVTPRPTVASLHKLPPQKRPPEGKKD